MDIIQKISADITSLLKEKNIFIPNIDLLTIAKDGMHGDYTSNIALIVAKQAKTSPIILAGEIVERIKVKKYDAIDSIAAVEPGFINIKLSQSFLITQSMRMLESFEKVIPTKKSDNLELIENTQPNTNKPLHIGHLRNIALGVSIVNLRRSIGKNAMSVNINNDRGAHICKAMLGYLYGGLDFTKNDSFVLKFNNSNKKNPIYWKKVLDKWYEDKELWITPEREKKAEYKKSDAFVGRFYVEGSTYEEERPVIKQYIQEMLQAWEDEDEKVKALWKQMNDWFYEGFRQTHSRFLGIKPTDAQFDKEWYESDIYRDGKEIVMENIDKGLFYKREDGAIVANLSKYNLPDKVVIRSDGTSIYITQDIALSKDRIEKYHAGLVAYVVGNEQDLHFKQLFAICEELKIGNQNNFLHISYGMVNLKGGVKMSSRTGTVITGDELMDSVHKKIKESFSMTDDHIVDSIAVSAIKYEMLKHHPKTAFDFDIEESISLEGNSGAYLQYTYARTQSILKKNKDREKTTFNYYENISLNEEELQLLRFLIHYDEVVKESATTYSPHTLCNYLYELSKKFNLFYQKHSILKAEHEYQSNLRIFITQVVGNILNNGFNLLGIVALKSM